MSERTTGSGRAPDHRPTRQAIASPGQEPIRQPAYQTLADEIRERILSGELRPGERLPTEPQLCTRSGLSRSTIREALRLLSSQHLIVTTRGVTGGSFVAEPSAARLGDSLATAMQVLCPDMTIGGGHFMEIRELIEVPGAALAASRRTDEQARDLLESVVDPADQDVEAKIATYWRFREVLAAAVHNPLYELLASPLRQMANGRELVESGPEELWRRVSTADSLIADRVLRQDSTGAAEATREHLRYVGDLYRESAVMLGAGPARAERISEGAPNAG